MRRWIPLVLLLCATPAIAQTRWIVGNTLIDVPPGIVLADAGKGYGKGHGRGGGAPAPSPAPAVSAPTPAPAPTGEMGRGETSFQYVPAGSVVIPPVAQAQVQPQPYAQPYVPPQPACPECGTTITVPIQVQLRASVQALTPTSQAQAPRPYPAPVNCPAGCTPMPTYPFPCYRP